MIPLNVQYKIFVISGPSGVGKDTILEKMAENGLPYHFVITATTRNPRTFEKEGVNHFFVNKKQFKHMIGKKELIEWAFGYGNYYGVPKTQVEEPVRKGKNVLIRVDIQGAQRLKKLYPGATLILIKPSDIRDLEERLVERGANTEVEISKRLKSAITEMETSLIFDYEIINQRNKLEKAISDLENIIKDVSRHKIN